MLYDAVTFPKAGKLEVTKLCTSSSGRRDPINSKEYFSFKQGFDYIDVPIYFLLGRFGYLIPDLSSYMSLQLGSSVGRPCEVIKVQSVCFETLRNVAGLKIVWVSSLALHLELDGGNKTLKLFQFPSFCRIMSEDRKNHILAR